jgi:hypothetical protein
MPLPKPAATRQRRNTWVTATTIKGAKVHKPELPERKDGSEWHHLTVAWWNLLWDSPISEEWVNVDLQLLYRVARLDHEFWSTKDGLTAARHALAINSLTRNLGLDPMSRRSLQWKVEPLDEAQPVAPPTGPIRDPRLAVVPDSRKRKAG